MPKEPIKLLAVNPGARYVGWAVFRGPELQDWGVRVVRAKTLLGKRRAVNAMLVEWIERFGSDYLVTKTLHRSRSSQGLNQLARSMIQLAERRKLSVAQYSIGQLKEALCPEGKANKRQLAEQIAGTYAVLAHDFQRETDNRNSYYLRMFEAVALGVVGYRQSEKQ